MCRPGRWCRALARHVRVCRGPSRGSNQWVEILDPKGLAPASLKPNACARPVSTHFARLTRELLAENRPHCVYMVRHCQLQVRQTLPDTETTPRPGGTQDRFRGDRPVPSTALHLHKDTPRDLAGHDTVCCTRDNEARSMFCNLPCVPGSCSSLSERDDLS